MKFNKIFNKIYNNWSELESVIENLPTSKEKGDAFEEFIYVYLNLKSQLYQLEEIYMSKNIPSKYLVKYKIEKKDSGVDGLMILADGSAAAYQVKFRSNRAKPSYDELAKFWVEGKNTDYNYTIANCYSVTTLSGKNHKHLQILVDEFESLDNIFFEDLFSFVNEQPLKTKKRFEPYPFQDKIIKDVVNGFKNNDRGKLIAACGTGKTLTSLWIIEELNVDTVLFLAPSLALIKQTLESWSEQSKTPFSYLCVCSDKSVSNSIDNDEGDLAISEFNVPVTTSPSEILQYLQSSFNSKKYIFSTYQSLPVIAESIKCTNNFTFDLLIFDEAHRTAGAKETALFNLALDDKTIGSKKRLFMTATERLIRPWLVKKATELGREVFSMDDEKIYGKLFHKFNFGEAISQGVISDYQIIVAGIQSSDFYNWIKSNQDLQTSLDGNTGYSSAQILFSQLILSKAIKEYPIQKVISFHSSVKNASLFTGGITNTIPLNRVIKDFNKNITDTNLFISHINGSMPTGDRKEILDIFKESEFGIISNARCLTEGVDVPVIDSIYFVDNKSSLIDIVQACGRALRKPNNIKEKTAYFLIPILIPDKIEAEEIVNIEAFETVFNVIQSLRDQDDRLSEWINDLNKNAIKGTIPKFNRGKWNPVTISLPNTIDLKSFEEKLYLKIADVNKNSNDYVNEPRTLYGKTERKSSKKRVFKTLGDYSFEAYFNSCVNPTMNFFHGKTSTLNIDNIKINNNNVSHTKRLGLIINEKKDYTITPLGEIFKAGKIEQKELFKRQMLRYFSSLEDGNEERILFPYRACLKILLEVDSINFIEFAFAIYTLYDNSTDSINQAISDIKHLREKYPNLSIVNQANSDLILNELNEYFNTNYTETDVWKKKTTINNQFIYFRDHLSLFDEFIKIEKQEIHFMPKGEVKARHLLSLDNRLEFETDHNKLASKYIQPFINFVIFTF